MLFRKFDSHVRPTNLTTSASCRSVRYDWRHFVYAIVLPCLCLVAAFSLTIAGEEQTQNTSKVDATDELKLDMDSDDPDSDPESAIQGMSKPERIAVSLSGKALNGRGLPVVGAQVYIVPVFPDNVSYNTNDDQALAEGKTNENGAFRFDDVKLFVYDFQDKVVPTPKEGLFQVFAVAKGYGYVWRATCHYRPGAKPKNDPKEGTDKKEANRESETEHPALVFYENEPIEVDVRFTPEVRVHGTITDDRGSKLKGAIVQVGFVSSTRGQFGAEPSSGKINYISGSQRGADGDLDFNAFKLIPEELRQAQTDENGHYEIRGLPKNASLLSRIDYLPEYDPLTELLGTGAKAVVSDDKRYFSREWNHTFIVPVPLRVHVVNESQEPIRDVVVRYETNGRVGRSKTLARTDDNGFAILNLIGRNVELYVEPTIGQPYLPVTQSLTLNKTESREESVDVVLKPAAVVTIEAINSETRSPVAGVGFLNEPAQGGKRKELQSQLSFVDHPRTDNAGRLEVVLPPGQNRFLVDQRSLKSGQQARNPISDILELKPGKNDVLRFEFSQKSADAEPESLKDELPVDLVKLIDRQQQTFRAVHGFRIHVSHTDHVSRKITEQTVKEILQAVESKPLDQCVKLLNGKSKGASHTGGRGTILTDRFRKRLEMDMDHYGGMAHVDNGRENIYPMSSSQLRIDDSAKSRIHHLEMNDFWRGPADFGLMKFYRPKTPPTIKASRAEGLWRVEIESKEYKRILAIDDSTGLVRTNTASHGDQMITFEGQYFPVVEPNGIAIPQLCVRFQRDSSNRRNVADATPSYSFGYSHIDQVEVLDRLPADAFIVAAQAGVNVVDLRGVDMTNRDGLSRIPSGVLTGSVPDVVAYRDRFAPPRAPVLKVGDKAPEFNVEAWVDASGKMTAPDLKGKVVLIDFWGIGCGFCVVQLPEVTAACKHFANNPKLAIIGLHDSGVPPDVVIEFSKKRGLNFLVAIDKPEQDWFGATYASFGVEGIPASAVIDSSGTVVYLGEFQQAIKVAAKLIE